ncbi:MAG: LVIVD repeat-containing protein [Candidatus Heimdallarchaeaceae archaeon]
MKMTKTKIRGRMIAFILLFSLFVFLSPLQEETSLVQAASGFYSEDFSTTTYMDGTKTNVTGWGTGNIQTPRKSPEIISQLNSTFVGEVQCVSVDGNFAYIGTRSLSAEYHLKIIDISDIADPEPVGSLLVSGQIMRIKITGDIAYLAVANTGLMIVDITDSTSPTHVTSSSIGGLTKDVSIEGNYAFVVNENVGVKVIDISDPSIPITSDQWQLNLPGTERSITISGDYAYVPAGTDLRILNIGDPTKPISAGNYTGFTSASQSCIFGDYLYVADDSDGLVVFDISNPRNLSYLYTNSYVGVFDLAVYGDFLYTTDLNYDLSVFSIMNPTKPVFLDSVDIGSIPPVLDLDGCHAFVAGTSKGLKILEIAEPFTPSILSSYDTSGRSYDVSIEGDYAYVADYTSGLLVFNITDPSSLDLIDSYNTPDTAFGVDISGNYAYVTDASSLQIINITDPTSLTLAGSFSTPSSAYSISISGNYAYLANYGSGLYVIDISDPSTPTFAGSYDTPGAAFGIDIHGDFAFIADFYGSNDLQILDISDPTSPFLAGSFNTPDQAYDLMISGNYAFIADYNYGLYIMDISNPTSPTEVSSLDTNYLAQGVFVSGDYVYLTDRSDGLSIIDVSDPDVPILIETISTPGETWEVVVVGNNAFVTDYENGFHVIEVRRNRLQLFHSPCSAQSLPVFSDSSTTISSATLSSQANIPENSYIDLYLSADNGSNWEQVSNDTEHVFANIGHQLKWKAMLNTQNMSSPLVINRIDINYSTSLVSPILSSPTDGFITEDYTPTFSWSIITGATNYLFQLDSNTDFISPLINETILAPNTDYTLDPYILPDIYYWRVAAIDSEGDIGAFSEIRSILIFEDLSIPIINSPNDFFYQIGTTGHQIVWIPSDSNPSLYNITLDGVLFDESIWIGGNIVIDIDGLGLGTYTFKCSVYDLLDHTTSDEVEVSVVPTQPPTIDDVADFEYEEDSTGNEITWHPSDDNPDWYFVTLDAVMINQNVWLGGDIAIDIDGLTYGLHTYVCTVNDTDGNEVSDIVIITVTDSVNPNLNSPGDIIYNEGDTGNSIIWIATDNNPATYVVYREGVQVDTNSWTSGSSIVISVDGLTAASYNYTIVVFDEAGNSVKDEVTVAVTPSVPEFTQTIFFALLSIMVVFVIINIKRRTYKKN